LQTTGGGGEEDQEPVRGHVEFAEPSERQRGRVFVSPRVGARASRGAPQGVELNEGFSGHKRDEKGGIKVFKTGF